MSEHESKAIREKVSLIDEALALPSEGGEAEAKFMMADCGHNKCPICLGRGNVPGGFYISTPGFGSISDRVQEVCRACQGQGIIWTQDIKAQTENTQLKEVAKPNDDFYQKQRDLFLADPADEALAGKIYDAFPSFEAGNMVNRKACVHLIAEAIRGERKECARICASYTRQGSDFPDGIALRDILLGFRR